MQTSQLIQLIQLIQPVRLLCVHVAAVLFKMYGEADKGGLVGREGLKAFILDMIAASPPPLTPLHRGNGDANGDTNGDVNGDVNGDINGDGDHGDHGDRHCDDEGDGVDGKIHAPFRRRSADAAAGTGGGGLEGEDADGTDLEVELEHLLARMAGVVLTEVGDILCS